MQRPEFTGESSSPVARFETLCLHPSVGVFLGWKWFKIDFVDAYHLTPMDPAVKHQHVSMQPELVEVLVTADPVFKQFLRPDGSIILKMKNLIYGNKESGYFWYCLLMSMFIKHGYRMSFGDPCLLIKHDNDCERSITVTVDDCLCGVSSETVKVEIIVMCRMEFKDKITEIEGDKNPTSRHDYGF
jgi:hypothetical protein